MVDREALIKVWSGVSFSGKLLILFDNGLPLHTYPNCSSTPV